MDFHPILVHFPIALLTVYAILELLTIHKFFRTPAWTHIRSALVIFGFSAALIAMQAGEIAAQLKYGGGNANAVIQMHSTWANVSAYIFGIIGVAYLLAIIHENSKLNSYYLRLPKSVQELLDVAVRIITKSPLRIFLALGGLTAITITGGLGGAIVYGPDLDPAVSVIYHLFFE